MNTQIQREYDIIIKKLLKMTNGKKIIIWGYLLDGLFLEYLFESHHKPIFMLLESDPKRGDGFKTKNTKRRKEELENINPREAMVFLTFVRSEEVDRYLGELGYREGEDYIYARELFYSEHKEYQKMHIGFFEWIHYVYGIDIGEKPASEMDYRFHDGGGSKFSTLMDYTFMRLLDQFEFDSDDAVFDFGCGKATALLLFDQCGVGKVGGVEYDHEMITIARDNFRKLGIDPEGLLEGDATLVKEELDQYNYFYLYNPYGGETFTKTVDNILESFRRKKRRITVIYAHPLNHKDFAKHPEFIRTMQIDVDCGLGYANVYILE